MQRQGETVSVRYTRIQPNTLQTGTLTKDEISLCHYVDPSGHENEKIVQLAYTNAINQSGKKNSIDSAILNFIDRREKVIARALGEKIAEIPFTFEKRRSSCIVSQPDGKLILVCKGAFEEVSMLCTQIRLGGECLQLIPDLRQELLRRAAAFNNDGFRVIVVATKEVQEHDLQTMDVLENLDSSMVMEGLLTFLDPPKEDAAASIQRLQDLGVDVKVLTGDNLGVALKVCRALELVRAVDEGAVQAITGPDLARLEAGEFDEVVQSCKVFAKLTPTQKGQIVMSLKESGKTVGMLGDGINDCIALRFADAGISVDTGAAVAMDCADGMLLSAGQNFSYADTSY